MAVYHCFPYRHSRFSPCLVPRRVQVGQWRDILDWTDQHHNSLRFFDAPVSGALLRSQVEITKDSVLWCRHGMVGHDGLHYFHYFPPSRSKLFVHDGTCYGSGALLLYSFSRCAIYRWSDRWQTLDKMERQEGEPGGMKECTVLDRPFFRERFRYFV